MERDAKKRNLSFLTAQAKAKQLYAIDMTSDEFVEMAYDVWRDIGNIATVLTRYFTKVPADFVVEIPKQCEFIDSVTSLEISPYPDSYDSSGKKDQHLPASYVKTTIPGIGDSTTTSNGMTVNYTNLNNNSIKITSPVLANSDLMIVYRSIDTDEDGLPLLNDKEVAAIAAEVAKRDIVRKLFQGVGLKDKSSQALLQYINSEAVRLVTAAKMDENITRDSLDKLLDIKTSWDRKVYGKRFNLLK